MLWRRDPWPERATGRQRLGLAGAEPAHRDQAERRSPELKPAPGRAGWACHARRYGLRLPQRPVASLPCTGRPGGSRSCPFCWLRFRHVWTVGADAPAGRHPKVAWEWNLAVTGAPIRDHPGRDWPQRALLRRGVSFPACSAA